MTLLPDRLYYVTCDNGEHVFIFLCLHKADEFYSEKAGATGKSVQLKPIKETKIWNHTLHFDETSFELLPESFTLDDFIKDEPFVAKLHDS